MVGGGAWGMINVRGDKKRQEQEYCSICVYIGHWTLDIENPASSINGVRRISKVD
jgi:hypothetical protein